MKLLRGTLHNRRMRDYRNLLLFLLFWITPAQAAWYQVEAIVFENLYLESNGELWYKNPGLPAREGSIALILDEFDADENGPAIQDPEQKVLVPFKVLPKDKNRMDGIYNAFRFSKEYRPLIHVSWQQPAVSRNRARAVHIEKLDGVFPGPELPEADLSDDNEPDFLVPPKSIVEGTIRVRSSHFLHIDVDFVYFLEALSNDGFITSGDAYGNAMFVNQNADYVRLKETRKIKLNELHYFDHPMFGIIVQVSRLRPE
ncbi:MAG: CsiV family protein [Gammaproteobacteria bacterium]